MLKGVKALFSTGLALLDYLNQHLMQMSDLCKRI